MSDRTRSEVLAARENAVMGGCCDRFADQTGCDCLETALPDSPPSGEWTTLDALNQEDLFETRDGRRFVLKHTTSFYVCEVGGHYRGALYAKAIVRLIDLSFLLACAADRLEENDVYHRGYREGAGQMQRRILHIVQTWMKQQSYPTLTANELRRLVADLPLLPVAGEEP